MPSWSLKRLDLHLAKLHRPRCRLKRDRPASMLAVLNIDGASAIEDYGEMCASCRDFIRVPVVRGFEKNRGFRHIYDRPGSIGRVRPLIEDIHLISIVGWDLLRIGTTKENSAVGLPIDPEFRPNFKVGIRSLRNQKTIALVSLHDAVRQLPVGVANLVPIIQA